MDSDAVHSQRGFFVTMTVFVVFLGASLLARLPPATMPGWFSDRAGSYAVLWPQRWAFFVGATSKDRIAAYPIRSDDSVAADSRVLMNPHTWWGLRRDAYVWVVETQRIAVQVPAGSWVRCNATDVAGCHNAARALRWYDVVNPYRSARLCGPVVLATHSPASVGAIRSGDAPWTTSRIALVRVHCGVRQ